MKPHSGSAPSRREWAAATIISIAFALFLLLPYALGYWAARPGLVFTGVLMNPEDSQSYIAKMLEGYDGMWLYTIPFTAEDHAPAFLGGVYLLLGHMARGTGLSVEVMWHLARFGAGILLSLMTFLFVSRFLPSARTRWLAFLLALFGSGLGWLLFLLNQPYWLHAFPVDFKMPEAHLFFTALTYPHVALGTTLVLASFWCMLEAWGSTLRKSWVCAAAAGLANLGIVIAYPFLIYLVAVTLALYWAFRVARVRRILFREGLLLALSGLVPAPLVAYYAYTLASNPAFRAWDAQAVTLSPPWPHLLVAYGPLLALALPTLGRSLATPGLREDREKALLWIWVASAAILVYAPLNAQRRFVQGVQVPLAILAAEGWLTAIWRWILRARPIQWVAARPRYSASGLERLFTLALLFFAALSNIYILASLAVTLAAQQPYPLFRPETEVASVAWLRQNTRRSDLVLAGYETGNYIAAQSGNRVVDGHWAETVDWERKEREVETFYHAGTEMKWRLDWLRENRVAYLWFGAHERELGFDPAPFSFWQPVYANSEVTIYRVLSSE